MCPARLAALALIVTLHSAANAQAVPDLSTAVPIAGIWTYTSLGNASEARFIDANSLPQLVITCSRSTRRVTLARSSSVPASSLGVWTSSQQRSVPATYSASAATVGADFDSNDTLLDALSTSRGRVGFTSGAAPALVVPSWPEISRVIEDCRT